MKNKHVYHYAHNRRGGLYEIICGTKETDNTCSTNEKAVTTCKKCLKILNETSLDSVVYSILQKVRRKELSIIDGTDALCALFKYGML